MVNSGPQLCQTSPEGRQEASSTLAANIDTLNALLLGLPAQTQTEGDGERIPAAWRQLFVEALVKNQQEQGEWKPCGQLPAQKRPLQETTQVTTAWTLLALDSNQLTAERNRRALATLRNANPTSTEWWAVRLLLSEKRQDKNADAFCDALIEKQQPDGGWGWLTSDRSDALATGLAIYALGRHDADQNRPAISKSGHFSDRQPIIRWFMASAWDQKNNPLTSRHLRQITGERHGRSLDSWNPNHRTSETLFLK